MNTIDREEAVMPTKAWEAARAAGDALRSAIEQAQSAIELLDSVATTSLAADEAEMEEARLRAAEEPFLDTTQPTDEADETTSAATLEVAPFPTEFDDSGPRTLSPELNARFNRVLARVFSAGPPAIEAAPSSALAFTPLPTTPENLENGAAHGNVKLNFANGGFSSHYTPSQAKKAAPAPSGGEEEDEPASVALPS